MLQTNYKKLSDVEILELKNILEEKLKLVNGQVEIDSIPSVIHASMSTAEHKNEWDEFWYTIKVKTDFGECELSENFPLAVKLADLVWHFLYEIWMKIDKNQNLESKLGKIVWNER